MPANALRLSEAIVSTWPRLRGRLHYRSMPFEEVALAPTDIVVSSHACGTLTDGVIDKVIQAGARLAVLPCCHDLSHSDTGGLTGWLDGPLAVDVMRTARLRNAGYAVVTQHIPHDITPKNRLLMGHRQGS
jgi:hypothetical protein